jgi:two-component sensor histidine kinase
MIFQDSLRNRKVGNGMVHRLANLDVPRRFSGSVPVWASKTGCALFGVGLAVSLRMIVNVVAPDAAPFALVYPCSLVVTLVGGWEAGVATLIFSQVLAWFFVVPLVGGVHNDIQVASAGLVFITGLAVVAAGEGFRVAAGRIVDERNAKLAERELLFRELQHRVNNDFTIVNSLLDLQRRRSNNPETRDSLEQAMGRVRSIARIHRHIYALPQGSSVDCKQYLTDLCSALSDATLPPAGITLRCDCVPANLPRDRALALGLVTNELVTNAVKHAFPDERDGTILVSFQARKDGGWQLVVSDDGVGIDSTQTRTGLGTGLIAEFVKQAGGSLTYTRQGGTTACLELDKAA